MSSLNKALIIGRVGKDPEQRFFNDGTAVCNVTIATSETWKDKQTGEKKEATEWHNVVFRSKLAEIAGQYLRKGSLVYVEGSLKTRKWQDKSGQDRYTTEIVANEMKMLGPKPEGQQQAAPRQQAPRQQAPQQQSGGGFADFQDDVPFSRIGQGMAVHVI